jgi:hypothetical protein
LKTNVPTPIRPSGDRAVDFSFLPLFDPESRCFFLAFANCQLPIAICSYEYTANQAKS